jgi:signal transduction histidine kinase/ligand-binding sensor domain-containing protein
MRRIPWFVLSLLWTHAASSAVPQKIAAIHNHRVWDAASGFPGGYVYSITQTADGYLWIGASKGLVRYDGIRFAFVHQENTEANFPILGLAPDSAGQLWAIDDVTHLLPYRDGHLGRPVPDHGPHRHRIAIATPTRGGSLLFASEAQGVIEYNQMTPHVLLDARAVPEFPTAIAQTSDGAIWIGTRDSGLFRLSVKPGVPAIEHVEGMPTAKINCFLPIEESTLLVGTSQGLLSLHNGTLVPQSRPELKSQEILALAKGLAGEIWISTNGGLFKAEANEIAAGGEIKSLDHLAAHSPVTSLFEDRDGNLWVGSPDTLECYRGNGFDTYSYSAGLPSINSGAVYVDPQGNAWFGPWDGGLFRLSNGQVEPITVSGLKDDAVYSIAGSAGEIWVAWKYSGVTRLRPRGDTFQDLTYTTRNGLAQNSVYSIYLAPDGTVWAGTINQGLSRFRDNTWHTFTTQDGLPSNRISVVTGNAAGDIFVGTPNGLAQFKPAEFKNDTWVAYTARDGLPPGAIESLLFDSSGTLWIGTAKGISFLRAGAIHVPLAAPDPLYGEILGIAENNGWLWITTGNHVLRVKCTALLNDVFEPGDYREFGVTDGLASVEGVKRSRSVVTDNRGRVWFSLNQGISVLPASAFSQPAFPMAIRLDGMLVDGKLVAPGGQIRVPSGQRRLTFQYGAVNVSNPEGVRYRYRLNPVDSGWSEPTALREVDYTNISPGRFTFHVEARNPDGVPSQEEATMIFDVEPAFWQDHRYQLAAIAALSLLAWYLYRLRLRQMTDRAELRHSERLAERTRVARDLHDTLLQSFQGLMLRLQVVDDMLPQGKAKDALEQTLDRADQAIAEGRNAVYDLRSSPVTATDLAQALRMLGDELTTPDAAAFRLVVEGPVRDMPEIIRDELYRITREALRNAFSHARAQQIEVELIYAEGLLRVRVRDDGAGIAPAILEEGRPGHYGLPGMRERARTIGAKLAIWSGIGAGTEIELSIPGSLAYSAPPRSRRRLFGRKRDHA